MANDMADSKTKDIGDLPRALGGLGGTEGDGGVGGELESTLKKSLQGKRPAVFLDYDGTLTPIVERPQDAIISESMREAVRSLAERCPVCVVSGRDRKVVQDLMGLDNLIVAGSHGFDIWSPEEGTIEHDAGSGFEELIEEVKDTLQEKALPYEGASVEPKKTSVAVHYRLVKEDKRSEIKQIVDNLLAERPEELKVTPGKMVYEVQPKIDWDKGKAVLFLLETLDLEGEDVVPIYLGDDITDEHAFEALKTLKSSSKASSRGIGIYVGDTEQEEARKSAADYVLESVPDVERFLNSLAR